MRRVMLLCVMNIVQIYAMQELNLQVIDTQTNKALPIAVVNSSLPLYGALNVLRSGDSKEHSGTVKYSSFGTPFMTIREPRLLVNQRCELTEKIGYKYTRTKPSGNYDGFIMSTTYWGEHACQKAQKDL